MQRGPDYMTNYSELMPRMLFGEELKERLTVLPDYDISVRKMDTSITFAN